MSNSDCSSRALTQEKPYIVDEMIVLANALGRHIYFFETA